VRVYQTYILKFKGTRRNQYKAVFVKFQQGRRGAPDQLLSDLLKCKKLQILQEIKVIYFVWMRYLFISLNLQIFVIFFCYKKISVDPRSISEAWLGLVTL